MLNKFICFLFGHKWEERWISMYTDFKYKHRNCLRCKEHQCVKREDCKITETVIKTYSN